MDILTVTNILAAASVVASGGLISIATRRLKNASDIERESADRSFDRAVELGDHRIEQLEERLAERNEVIDLYYDQLILDQKTIAIATLKIRDLLTTNAITNEMAEDLDIVLRSYFPSLPESYDPSEVVNTLLASALGQSFVDTFRDSPEDGKRFIADLVQKLIAEIELRDGEVEDGRMKHEHLMGVLFDRNRELAELQGLFDAQAEVITELRNEKELAEVELTATKVVANDDSADADRYADDLRKADEIIGFLRTELSRAEIGYAVSDQMLLDMNTSAERLAVRDAHERGEGVAIARLAA